MKFKRLICGLSLFAYSVAHAADVDPAQLAIIGGTSPNPATSEGYYTVYNRLDQDIVCDLRVTGVITGRDQSGLLLTATQDSQPLRGMRLRSHHERELRFSFASAVLAMRKQWRDPYAKLTSVDREFSYFHCTVIDNPSEGDSTNSSGPVAGKPYMIVNEHSRKCLNVDVKRLGVDGYNNGGTVFQYDCPTGTTNWTNNFWFFDPVRAPGGSTPGFTTMIKSVYSRKCLDLYTVNGGSADGEQVQQYDCVIGRSSEINRNWTLVFAGGGSYYIKSAWSNKCLDVAASDPNRDGFNNGGRVQQWECGSRPYRQNQLWRLVPVNQSLP